MILRDFQVHCFPAWGLAGSFNRAAFPVYEAVRLDLRPRRLSAPFKKIVITPVDDATIEASRVCVALNICEALVPINRQMLSDAMSAVANVVALARRGLRAIELSQGFADAGIDQSLEQCLYRNPPCLYRFARLGRTSRAGLRCEAEFLAEAGHGFVRVGFFRDAEIIGAVTVKEKPGLLWLEDDFPLKRSRIRAGRFELLDRRGSVIAAVPIPRDSA